MGDLHHSIPHSDLGARKHAAGIIVRKIVKLSCELCHDKARVYCAADQAQLCFVCDSKVHTANFLVSKHSRDVLCSSCGALTLLAFTGPRIECPPHHCSKCSQNTDGCGNMAAPAAPTPLLSLESCNSSCCTEEEEQEEGEVPVSVHGAVFPHSKRRAFIVLEEGCGDSEDQYCNSSPPPCLSKRKRVALARDNSHRRRAVARRTGTSSQAQL